jgi:hypothetical protein
MSTLLVTLLISFIIVTLATALLAIGWLLTGKQKLKPGACGRDPNKQKSDGCGANQSCQLCEKHDDKPKQE